MQPAEIITARAPELAAANSERIPTLITLAGEQTGSVFGVQRNSAIAMLVLHWLASEASASAGGALTSEKEGELQRSYGSAPSNDDLDSTRWGQERKRLARGAGVLMPRNRMVYP